MSKVPLTVNGAELLRQELHRLKTVDRPSVINAISEARAQGDLSENAEYTEAKEAQSLNEGRVEELKAILDNAVIITAGGKGGIVSVGSTLTVQNGKEPRTFTIVGAAEADPAAGKISNESPLGAAFLGHKKGDKVPVRTPKGETEYKITEVK